MLARCTRCRSTFFTDQYGLQTCPKCHAQVLISDPNAPPESRETTEEQRVVDVETAASGETEREHADHHEDSLAFEEQEEQGAAPGHGYSSENDPSIPPWYRTDKSPDGEEQETELTPWERQDELGFARGFLDTVGRMLGEPGGLLGRMRWTEARSAHTYFLLVAVMPAVIGAIINMQLQDQEASMQAMEEAIQGLPEANQEAARQLAEFFASSGTPGLVGTIVGFPLMYFGLLYLLAGITHLFLMLLGEARSGWTGTFKAFVYGCTPMIFAIVPICGSTVAQFWATGLCVYGIMKAHRTNLGYAIIGVVGIPLLLCCCFGGLGTALLVAQLTGAGLP